MFRIIRWPLLALFLIVVGAWPAAATPVTLAGAGAVVILAAIPGPALLLLVVIAWLKHRPAPKAVAA